nr:hypothetical protein [Terrihabitans soli]
MHTWRLAFTDGFHTGAYRSAKQIWIVNYKRKDVDALKSEATGVIDKPLKVVGYAPACVEQLRRLKSEEGMKPSTGLAGAFHLMELYPDAILHLFGFGHAGEYGHDWTAERALFDKWISEGRVVRHVASEITFLERASLRLHRLRRAGERLITKMTSHRDLQAWAAED